MEDAVTIFSRVFLSLNQKWSDVYGFRQLVELGLPHAVKIVAADNLEATRQFMSQPDFDKVVLDRQKFMKYSGGLQGMAAGLAEMQVANLRVSVDSASLVFMHSALDGATFDLC